MAKRTTEKHKLISLNIFVESWMEEEDIIQEIFSKLINEDHDPESFLYTGTDGQRKQTLRKYGVPEKEEDYFFAFTYDEVDKFDNAGGKLIKLAERFERPLVALHFLEKSDNIQNLFDEEKVLKLESEKVGNATYIYSAIDGNLKSTYAGSVELKYPKKRVFLGVSE